MRSAILSHLTFQQRGKEAITRVDARNRAQVWPSNQRIRIAHERTLVMKFTQSISHFEQPKGIVGVQNVLDYYLIFFRLERAG